MNSIRKAELVGMAKAKREKAMNNDPADRYFPEEQTKYPAVVRRG